MVSRWVKRIGALAASLLLCGAGSRAQSDVSAHQAPAFDVVSIRAAASDSEGFSFQFTDDGFIAKNATLLQLMTEAYELREDLILDLPAWASTARWDVHVKSSEGDSAAIKKLSWHERHAMLQPVLAERFGVRAHRSSKVMPIYELVVAPGGPKLKRSEVQTETSDTQLKGLHVGGVRMSDKGRIITFSTPVSTLVNSLSTLLKQTIVDHTGLTQRYDMELRWTPDEQTAASQDVSQAPGIFTAIQEQLGLKLLPAKAPVDDLVVERASRPTEN